MEHPTHQIIRFLDLVFLKSINDAQLQIKGELLIHHSLWEISEYRFQP